MSMNEGISSPWRLYVHFFLTHAYRLVINMIGAKPFHGKYSGRAYVANDGLGRIGFVAKVCP